MNDWVYYCAYDYFIYDVLLIFYSEQIFFFLKMSFYDVGGVFVFARRNFYVVLEIIYKFIIHFYYVVDINMWSVIVYHDLTHVLDLNQTTLIQELTFKKPI